MYASFLRLTGEAISLGEQLMLTHGRLPTIK